MPDSPTCQDKKVFRPLIPFVLREYMLTYIHQKQQCTNLSGLSVLGMTCSIYACVHMAL